MKKASKFVSVKCQMDFFGSNMMVPAPVLLLVLLLSHVASQTNDAENVICGGKRTCNSCTPTDGCGWCSDIKTSGDKTTQEKIGLCVALNSTHPGSPPEGRRCNDGFHNSVCPCPNQCSGHGVCSVKGSCDCYRAYEGDDCAQAKENAFNPAVVVPLSIAVIGVMVGGIVFLHLRQSGEARHGGKENSPSKNTNQEVETVGTSGIALKSKFAKYSDAIN